MRHSGPLIFVALGAACAAPSVSPDAEQRLLALHEAVLEAHRTGNVDLWMSVEGDEYVSANGGAITFPSAAERRAMRTPYLAATTFDSYRDTRDPVVRVSDDGTLGWVIAEVEVAGARLGGDSTLTPIHETWAWIELYRKVDGEWKLVGNVSNRRG
jgi:hypothetical protein